LIFTSAPLVQPAFPELFARARPLWMFNYTSLQKGLERARVEAGVFEEVKELPPAGGPAGGRKLGTLVHAMLERVDPGSFAGRDPEAWMALPATAALAEGLPREDRNPALRWVHQAMTRPLPLPGGGSVALCQAEELLRELDFVTPYPGRPDYLNGSIDALFQAGGRAHVLDWKTNQLPGYGPAALDEAVQAHYLLQVKIYALTTCRFLGITERERKPVAHVSFGRSLRSLPVPFRRFLVAVGLFGLGDFAHSLFILLATQKLTPLLGPAKAASVAVGLYVLHNVCYAGFAFDRKVPDPSPIDGTALMIYCTLLMSRSIVRLGSEAWRRARALRRDSTRRNTRQRQSRRDRRASSPRCDGRGCR